MAIYRAFPGSSAKYGLRAATAERPQARLSINRVRGLDSSLSIGLSLSRSLFPSWGSSMAPAARVERGWGGPWILSLAPLRFFCNVRKEVSGEEWVWGWARGTIEDVHSSSCSVVTASW